MLMLAGAKANAATIWLDDLDVNLTIQDWGDPQKNQSVNGHGLTIGGQTFAHGLGTHAESILYINLKSAAQTFSASVGVDGEITSSHKQASNSRFWATEKFSGKAAC